MKSPLPPLRSCVLLLLQEAYDPNGKHMEFRDSTGALFARMTKVYKRNAFSALFDVFRPAQDIYAELRDANDNLLLTTTSHRGDTKRECRMDLFLPDGTLWGRLYDASYGVEFTTPDDTVLGVARRPDDSPTEPMEVTYTYSNADGQAIGTCVRGYPDRSHSLWDTLFYGDTNLLGRPIQRVTIETDVEPELQAFLLLFPALQHLRYSRSG